MKHRNKKLYFKGFAMLFWLLFLQQSNAYYVPYLIVGTAGILCFYANEKEKKEPPKGKEQMFLFVLSIIFAMVAAASNYGVFRDLACPKEAGKLFQWCYKGISVILVFGGGYFISWNLLSRIKKCNFSWSKTHYEIKPTAVFALSALVFSVFHLLLLFMTKYPGILSEDSMSQIGQILSGEYSNHHPFYHTQIIRLFITIGFALFGEINAAIAVYSTFQVLLMACCFAFVSVTLYQMNISCRWIALCNLWYILMPFHIMYSFTMWKDVLFGGMLLVFTTAVYRLQKGIGRYQAVNYILTALGGICVCLLRSNGWIVFLFSSVLFIILFREKYKWLKVVFAGILVLTYVMTHPVLKWLDVSQVNIVEALSIPIQQIARVVKDCDDLNEEQTELLNKVVDVDKLSEAYNPVISDPVKDLIRAKENTDYIKEHKGDFLKLWLKLGITHPGSYMAAWIDQTRGYWDSGFPYWRWANVVVENDMGIHQTINAPYINKILNEYLWLYENVGALQIFLCIGFYVWIIVLLGYINMLRRDKAAVFSIVPSLALIASLLLASPVYSEFRYAYGVFCTIPFLTAASFYKNEG